MTFLLFTVGLLLIIFFYVEFEKEIDLSKIGTVQFSQSSSRLSLSSLSISFYFQVNKKAKCINWSPMIDKRKI